MNDQAEHELLDKVGRLVERARSLREHLADPQDADRVNERAALRHLEEELDQCWDLLRQRRALLAVHEDPEAAHVRPVEQVENYLPRPGGPT
jgi:hypothetical protein